MCPVICRLVILPCKKVGAKASLYALATSMRSFTRTGNTGDVQSLILRFWSSFYGFYLNLKLYAEGLRQLGIYFFRSQLY